MNSLPETCDDCIYYGCKPHPYKGWSDGCELCGHCMDDDQEDDWIYDGDSRPKNCPLMEIPKEKEMPWYLSIFNTELLKQKGHWITDDAWSDIAYNTEFLEFLYNHINPNDMEHYRQMFEMKDAVAVNGAEKESSDERDSD